jgi:hypothetical protein
MGGPDQDSDPTFHTDADPDPNHTFQFNAFPDPNLTNYFFPDLNLPHAPKLACKASTFSLWCRTDPDPDFHFDADPDPAFQIDKDPDPDIHLLIFS